MNHLVIFHQAESDTDISVMKDGDKLFKDSKVHHLSGFNFISSEEDKYYSVFTYLLNALNT